MAQDKRPTRKLSERILRLALAALLAGAQTAPVFAQGASMLATRNAPALPQLPPGNALSAEIKAFRADLAAYLLGEKPGSLDAFKVRHRDLAARAEASADKEVLKTHLQELSDALDKAGGEAGSALSKTEMAALGQALSDERDGGAAGTLSGVSRDPGVAGKAYDGGNVKPAADGVVVPDQTGAKPAVATTKTHKTTDLGLTTPAPEEDKDGDEGPGALREALAPFRDMLPDAARRKFVENRLDQRVELLRLGREVLPEAERKNHADLASLVKRLAELAKASPDSNDLQIVIIKIRLHQNFIQQAIQADAIPKGTELEAWELQQQETPGQKIKFETRKHGNETYVGYLYKFTDGTSRFQGEGESGKRALVIVESPAANMRSTTVVEFDDQKKTKAYHTVVVDPRTELKIREEMADIAKELNKITSYGPDGAVANEVTIAEDGRKTLSDFGRNIKIESGADGKAKITPLTKGGPAQFKVQYGGFDAQGRLVIERTVLNDDKQLVNRSANVVQVLDPSGKTLSYEVSLTQLLKTAKGKDRDALALALAAEALKDMNMADPDGKRAAALASFLFDVDTFAVGNVPVRLSVGADGQFRFIYDMVDGQKKIILGRLELSTAYGGRARVPAFIILGAVYVDAENKALQDRAGYWREYTSDGRRLEWSKQEDTVRHSRWKFWADDEKTTTVFISEARRNAEREWVEAEKVEYKKNTQDVPGTSFMGRIEQGIMDVPVLGDTLGFFGDVGSILYTGIVAAPQVFISAATGSDMYGLEAGGSYAKNPLMRKLVDEQGYIDRLTDGAREELYNKVRESRRKSLESQTFPMPPEAINQAVNAPITAKEAFEVLKANYGAGTYGARLIDAAQDSGTLGKIGMTGLGMATGFFESAAEGLMNPLVWATFGLGEAVAAARTSMAVVQGGRMATLGFRALVATEWAVWGSVMVPWTISAADNIGKTLEGTYDASFGDKHFDGAYFKQLTKTTTDVVFLGLMVKGAKDGLALRRAQKADIAALKAKIRESKAAKEAEAMKSKAKTADPAPEPKPEEKTWWERFKEKLPKAEGKLPRWVAPKVAVAPAARPSSDEDGERASDHEVPHPIYPDPIDRRRGDDDGDKHSDRPADDKDNKDDKKAEEKVAKKDETKPKISKGGGNNSDSGSGSGGKGGPSTPSGSSGGSGGSGGGAGGGGDGGGSGSGGAPNGVAATGPAPFSAASNPEPPAPVNGPSSGGGSPAAARHTELPSDVPLGTPQQRLTRDAYDGSKPQGPLTLAYGPQPWGKFTVGGYGDGNPSLSPFSPKLGAIEKKEKHQKTREPLRFASAKDFSPSEPLRDAVAELTASQPADGYASYLPPAAWDYLYKGSKVPDSRKDPKDANWPWELALELAALGAALALANNSELAYTMGLRRRKPKPAEAPEQPPTLYS